MSTCAEWWHLAEAWSSDYCVVLYDRAGYGRSTMSTRPRTLDDIAVEAFTLLDCLNITEPVVVVGHSMGGLYAQKYALAFPKRVCGLVLLDPVCANNAELACLLTPREYRAGGVDKSRNLIWGRRLCALGLGFALRPLLAKAPPFHYKSDFTAEAREYILGNLTHARAYRVALAEYAVLKCERDLAVLSTSEGFPPIPIELVLSDPDTIIRETRHYGGADWATATKVQQIWHRMMRGYLSLSLESRETVTQRGSHYLHLTAAAEVKQAIDDINVSWSGWPGRSAAP